MNSHTTVISLGGSLVIPNSINIDFLTEFKDLISRHVEGGREFLIVVGGGATARSYQHALRDLGVDEANSLDWMRIEATRLNGKLVARIFGSEEVVERVEDLGSSHHPITVAAGWEPGQSTDAVALKAAAVLGAEEVIIISDIDHIYTADPKKNPDAKSLDAVSWEELEALLPDKWSPGEHVPLDVEALRTGHAHDMNVIFMAGKDLLALQKYLDSGEIEGTRIHP